MSTPSSNGITISTQQMPVPPMQPYDDHRRSQMGGFKGIQSPGPHGHFRPGPGGPSQPFLSQTPMMHQPNGYDAYQPEGYIVTPVAGKRKANRASQACDNCRTLKAKCDESRPCKTCKEKGLECKYRDPTPKAADKVQTEILEGINKLHKLLDVMNEHISQNDQDMKHVMKYLQQKDPSWLFKREDQEPLEPNHTATGSHPLPEVGFARDEKHMEMQRPRANSPNDFCQPSKPAVERGLQQEEEVEAEPGPVVRPGEPSIPPDHTTGAGHLLDWPGINEMVTDILTKLNVVFTNEYPIRQEEARGLLRIHGRGEGRDIESSIYTGSDEHGMFDLDDNMSDMSSPYVDERWGYGGPSSPMNFNDGSSLPARSPNSWILGGLDFEPDTMMELGASFIRHILNMHPIFTMPQVQACMKGFLNSLPKASNFPAIGNLKYPEGVTCTPGAPCSESEIDLNPDLCHLNSPSKKRKHDSNEAFTKLFIEPPGCQKFGKPPRTINSALVLMMLALGKICLHRDCVPDVVHEDQISGPTATSNSPSAVKSGGGVLSSPHQDSPKDIPGLRGGHSPSDRRSSLHAQTGKTNLGTINSTANAGVGSSAAPPKNMTVIPGLDYFAMALEIIGSQLGGNSLKHVHANLLVGLYFGQLGRVIESHAYIAAGSTILLNIMRPTLNRLRELRVCEKLPQRHRDNQLILAFWTCLQLESDIVAELPRQQSGILAYDGTLPYPNLTLFHPTGLGPFSERVYMSYMAQLYLRRHLNQIHRMFYGPNADKVLDPKTDFCDVETAQLRVADMQWVGPNFRFDEDDPPATDILAARLRAKYWGAQVITYRPFLKQILDFGSKMQNGHSYCAVSEFRPGVEAPIISPKTESYDDISDKIKEYAQMAIRALVESTQAFHNLGPKRPIITNVFGTAHAQWGNSLVLAACYRNNLLRGFIDRGNLVILIDKTLAFLKQSACQRSALEIDRRILKHVRSGIFPNESVTPQDVMDRTDSMNLATTSAATGQRLPWVPKKEPVPVVPRSKDGDVEAIDESEGKSMAAPAVPVPGAAGASTLHPSGYAASRINSVTGAPNGTAAPCIIASPWIGSRVLGNSSGIMPLSAMPSVCGDRRSAETGGTSICTTRNVPAAPSPRPGSSSTGSGADASRAASAAARCAGVMGRRGVEQDLVDARKRGDVVIAHRSPQGGGVVLAHLHDLVGVAVAHKVGLLDAVEKGVGNVPADAVAHMQVPRQRRLVQVGEQAKGQVAQEEVFVVEAAARTLEKGAEAGQEEGEVAEAGHGDEEGLGGPVGVGYEERDALSPEFLGECIGLHGG
ncbi:hypothetical protein TD95_000703 [Thielaviopsis punctulata]|uniref:Zn(2)-C6 fungal-type domain-containing protein n=1 Tax=Thielaviopsis punctulata TaxID=72032 RepID=A0A0F4ZGB7_9PEZI|nr:hypothetical protein TD95_000703 [Thielaviopsis punctulata]